MNSDWQPSQANQHQVFERLGVQISALITFLMGVINLLSAIRPTLADRLALIESFIPVEVRFSSRLTTALVGFALLVIATNLWHRKHVAWLLTIALLALSIFTHLFKGLDFEEAAFSLALFILLILLRDSFHAESDPPSVRQGIRVLVTAFIFTTLYGTIGLYVLDRHFNSQFSLLEALQQTTLMFIANYSPMAEPLTRFGRYFFNSIPIVGFATLGFAIFMLLRPILVRLPASAVEHKKAVEIVEKYGRTSLARAVLFEDKSYFFDPADTVIAYAVRGRGVIALGDPIGPVEQIPTAIQHFHEFCAQNDWMPAFASTLPDYLDQYRKIGMEEICIGYEAIVDLQNFSLEGSQNKDVRNAVNRMIRNGYQVKIYQPPIEDRLINTLHGISNLWLTIHKGGEMHFSDGWFSEKYIRSCPIAVVFSAEGTATAFANLVGEYQNNEITIDLMRHLPKIENGTMEFLFAQMLSWAKEAGYHTFSLGLSPVVGVGEKPDDPRIERALHTISEFASRFFNFRGLRHFKEKFHPNWEARYLIYPGVASLPQVLASLIRVHSRNSILENFLPKHRN